MANGNWNWWKTANCTGDIIEDMIAHYERFGAWPGEEDVQYIRHLKTSWDWLTYFVGYREALHEAMDTYMAREATAKRLGQFQERLKEATRPKEASQVQGDAVRVTGAEKMSAAKDEAAKATAADVEEISSTIVCGFYEAALEADLAARM